jgi:hypothetical protein
MLKRFEEAREHSTETVTKLEIRHKIIEEHN